MKTQYFFSKLLMFLVFTTSINAVQAACVYEKAIEGEEHQIGIMLTWSTSFEQGNSMFIVEKSADGQEFSDVGQVEAAGDANDGSEYRFLDVMPGSDRVFYRLKQIDLDGTFSLSEVSLVDKKIANNFMVVMMSQIATSKTFDVTLDVFKDVEMSYELRDSQGKKIKSETKAMYNGLNDITVDLTDERPGIYKLVLNLDDEEEILVIKRVLDELESKPNVASKDVLRRKRQ